MEDRGNPQEPGPTGAQIPGEGEVWRLRQMFSAACRNGAMPAAYHLSIGVDIPADSMADEALRLWQRREFPLMASWLLGMVAELRPEILVRDQTRPEWEALLSWWLSNDDPDSSYPKPAQLVAGTAPAEQAA